MAGFKAGLFSIFLSELHFHSHHLPCREQLQGRFWRVFTLAFFPLTPRSDVVVPWCAGVAGLEPSWGVVSVSSLVFIPGQGKSSVVCCAPVKLERSLRGERLMQLQSPQKCVIFQVWGRKWLTGLQGSLKFRDQCQVAVSHSLLDPSDLCDNIQRGLWCLYHVLVIPMALSTHTAAEAPWAVFWAQDPLDEGHSCLLPMSLAAESCSSAGAAHAQGEKVIILAWTESHSVKHSRGLQLPGGICLSVK